MAFAGMLLALAGAALGVVAETPWVLGPKPDGYTCRWTVTARPVTDPDDAGRDLGWILEGRRYEPSFLKGYFEARPAVVVGYTISHEAGPPLLRSWIGREAVEVDLWGLGDLLTLESVRADVERLRRDLAPGVLSSPHLAGRAVRVDALFPARTWVNGRGVAAWFGRAALAAGAMVAAGAGLASATWRQRKRRILAGVCPGCEYPLRGLGVERCPECGLMLTVYEQSILDAQGSPWGMGEMAGGGHTPAMT